MSPDAPYLKMAQNNAWANQTLYAALAGMSERAFAAARPGFFPSLSATLNHIFAVDLFYCDALSMAGRGLAVFNHTQIDAPQTLAVRHAEADARLISFCNTLTPAILPSTRLVARLTGPTHETVSALLLHLFQHQIHHRGQAHVQLQTAGLAPPQLDDFHLEFERAESAQSATP